jgi:hypothetical protein
MRDDSSTAVPTEPVDDPVLEVVRRILQVGGEMHEREVRQLARELGVPDDELEKLWTHDPKVLDTKDDHKVVTPIGRHRLNNMR